MMSLAETIFPSSRDELNFQDWLKSQPSEVKERFETLLDLFQTKKQADLSELQDELESVLDDKEDLEREQPEISDLQHDLNVLEGDFAALQKDHATLEKDRDAMVVRCAELEEALKKTITNPVVPNQATQADNTEKETVLKSYEERLTEYETRLAKYIEEVGQFLAQSTQNLEMSKEALTSMLDGFKQAHKELSPNTAPKTRKTRAKKGESSVEEVVPESGLTEENTTSIESEVPAVTHTEVEPPVELVSDPEPVVADTTPEIVVLPIRTELTVLPADKPWDRQLSPDFGGKEKLGGGLTNVGASHAADKDSQSVVAETTPVSTSVHSDNAVGMYHTDNGADLTTLDVHTEVVDIVVGMDAGEESFTDTEKESALDVLDTDIQPTPVAVRLAEAEAAFADMDESRKSIFGEEELPESIEFGIINDSDLKDLMVSKVEVLQESPKHILVDTVTDNNNEYTWGAVAAESGLGVQQGIVTGDPLVAMYVDSVADDVTDMVSDITDELEIETEDTTEANQDIVEPQDEEEFTFDDGGSSISVEPPVEETPIVTLKTPPTGPTGYVDAFGDEITGGANLSLDEKHGVVDMDSEGQWVLKFANGKTQPLSELDLNNAILM